MKTLSIFSYKNILAATSDLENGKFINDIKGSGQLGVVVALENVEITEAAKQLIKKAPREKGSFACIMIMDNAIGLMGFRYHLFQDEDLCISRDCILESLDKIDIMDESQIPDDFIAAMMQRESGSESFSE
jgi:hypothetical protein